MAITNIIPGTSPTYRFEITDPVTGDPFDLTDYQVYFFLKRSLQDLDGAAEFSGSIDDGVSVAYERRDGVVDVAVPSQASANLRVGRPYPYFLRVILIADPTQTFIPIRGELLPVLPPDE
jgi:hypothetical protein